MQHFSAEKAAKVQALREKMRAQHAAGAPTVALEEIFAPKAVALTEAHEGQTHDEDGYPLLLTEQDIVNALNGIRKPRQIP